MNSITLINTTEAAKILGISQLHARRLCRQGRLPAVKFGRDWVMLKSIVRKEQSLDGRRRYDRDHNMQTH